MTSWESSANWDGTNGDRGLAPIAIVKRTDPVVRPQPAADVVLVKPSNPQEISSILRLANEEKIAVFPRGGGTGLVGSAIPTENGIVLSLERMDNIEVDSANLMVVAEAGVTLGTLIETAEKVNLFFPLHPGATFTCL